MWDQRGSCYTCCHGPGKALASLLLQGSKPCLISCRGRRGGLQRKCSPLQEAKTGMFSSPTGQVCGGPCVKALGSPHPAGQDQGCSGSYWPPGGTAVPITFLRARSEVPGPGPQTLLQLSLKTQASSLGGLAKQVVMQSYYVSANIPALQGTQRWARRVPALCRALSSSGSDGAHVLDSCQSPALSALILQMGKLRLREKASTDRHQPPGGRPDPRSSYSPQSPPFVETRGDRWPLTSLDTNS